MNRASSGPPTRLYGRVAAAAEGTGSWGGGNVQCRITGPLTSSRYPLAMPAHNSGVLIGPRATPQHFGCGDLAPMDRAVYVRALDARRPGQTDASSPPSRSNGISTQINYTAPISSSMRVRNLRGAAVGKALRASKPFVSFKSHDTNVVTTHLRRVRSGGACAPKKKGALENRSLTLPAINAWGSIPRSNY